LCGPDLSLGAKQLDASLLLLPLVGIVNLSGRGMLVVWWRGSSGRGTPLLAYHAAPLKPSGPEKAALGQLS
jgi:hypothetical protein